jgi:hypothetical protein
MSVLHVPLLYVQLLYVQSLYGLILYVQQMNQKLIENAKEGHIPFCKTDANRTQFSEPLFIGQGKEDTAHVVGKDSIFWNQGHKFLAH